LEARMRVLASAFIVATLLLNSSCAVLEMETRNRGGYLDYVVDDLWMKADSKGMRALRAFAIQVSLARIASVSAKNDSDRQLLAIRLGALTKRFFPIYNCAFDTNPLGVPGAERDPCFYYDSAMVEYSTGLFDLAMVALPVDDAKKLVNTVTGAFINPINIADLVTALLNLGRDALKYGRVVGGLYRDSVELEVQLWLSTPAIDDRPPPYRVTDDQVAGLREIYARRNDDMPSWLAAIAALRGQGLEPLPHPKFFGELGGLLNYVCGLITKDPDALKSCQVNLPRTLPPAPSVLSSSGPGRIGGVIVATALSSTASKIKKPIDTGQSTNPDYEKIIAGYDPALHKIGYVQGVLAKLCVRSNERTITPRMNVLIKVYQQYVHGGEIAAGTAKPEQIVTGKLTQVEMTALNEVKGDCPSGRANYYEWRDLRFAQGINAPDVIKLVNRKLEGAQQLPPDASVQAVRDKIAALRPGLASGLVLNDDALASQFTPDLVSQLRN
jgi:hypothetical protein